MSVLADWRFCPKCGQELAHTDDHLHCPGCDERYWANSVPGAQAVIVRDRHVLLGRRAHDPGRGRWDLPGGFLQEGEDAVAALRREVREETNLELELLDFLGTWNEAYWNRTVLCLTWLATPAGGTAQAGDDLAEIHWFPYNERPRGDELAFPTFEEILSLALGRDEHG
ncbi:MAG TPA: NUDIX domain-containing protein, partial [Gaiellaceae bacterium]|nr:NUDIX domain-containing protein [Gaiellaceae bacterium]